MNKRGLFVILVLSMFLISGCYTSSESILEEKRTEIKQKMADISKDVAKKEEPKEEIKEEPCPEFPDLKLSIIWDKKGIIITKYYFSNEKGVDYEGWKLAGGWYWYLTSNYVTYCFKGFKEGQNTNYYYCGDDDSPVIAVKSITDKDGNILETIERNIIFVFDSSTETLVETICT